MKPLYCHCEERQRRSNLSCIYRDRLLRSLRSLAMTAVLTCAAHAQDLEQGKKLYEAKCMQCHGAGGAADGPAASVVFPKPRNFTTGAYKIRTTASGELPTDKDIFLSIGKGMHGTSMPAWEDALSEKERWALVHYVKTFFPGFAEVTPPPQGGGAKPQPAAFGKAPRLTEALITEGKALYEKMQCFQCHGMQGRGDGPSAATLTDDWGERIDAADLTKPWTFRGGPDLQDIFLRFTTGVSGTPMPSYAGVFDSENPKEDERQRWALAAYVQSLGRKPNWEFVVKGKRTESEKLPVGPADPAWQNVPVTDIRLAGQVVREPRQFTPRVDAMAVQVLYNATSVAFRVAWNDRTFTVEDPPDAVALQFPAGPVTDAKERPYFLGGDPNHPVTLWTWDAKSGKAKALNSTQLENPAPASEARQNLLAGATYYHGEWQLVIQRPLQTAGPSQDVPFAPGAFLPVAFSVWDGAGGESGNKRAISSWIHVVLEPPTPIRVYVYPVLAVGLVALLEFWLLARIKRRKFNI